MKGKKPLVSVIITTKNEEDVIGRLLKSLTKQTYSRVEIIVVDNNSSDKTKSIARRHTRNVFDYGPERSAQRNFGVKKARGKYVFVLDADMRLTSKVIEECVGLCEKDGKIGALTIPEESVTTNYWEKVKAFERSFYNLEGDEITDAARFFPKKVFREVGGYDETITGPEDWDLSASIRRAGYRIKRIKALIYHYERVPSVWSLLRKKYYYALKSHRYIKKQNISTFSPETVYFLRPVFYKNWKRLVIHPFLGVSMIAMLTLELFTGGLGFLIGKVQKL